MAECNHEEADTRIMIHVKDVLENGDNVVIVRTVDTDVIVLLVGMFHHFREKNPSGEIWVAFGTAKRYCYYHVNTIFEKLGRNKSISLPPFHAFTGCDSTSSFFGSKKSAWLAWNACPEVTEALLFIAANPYASVNLLLLHYTTLERFTVVLYHKTSSLSSVVLYHKTSSLSSVVLYHKTSSLSSVVLYHKTSSLSSVVLYHKTLSIIC